MNILSTIGHGLRGWFYPHEQTKTQSAEVPSQEPVPEETDLPSSTSDQRPPLQKHTSLQDELLALLKAREARSRKIVSGINKEVGDLNDVITKIDKLSQLIFPIVSGGKAPSAKQYTSAIDELKKLKIDLNLSSSVPSKEETRDALSHVNHHREKAALEQKERAQKMQQEVELKNQFLKIIDEMIRKLDECARKVISNTGGAR